MPLLPTTVKQLILMSALAGQVYNTVHEMMQRLRPVLLDDLGLRDGLVELLQQWQNQHPEIKLRTELENIEPLPQTVQLPTLSIVQEALTNIANTQMRTMSKSDWYSGTRKR